MLSKAGGQVVVSHDAGRMVGAQAIVWPGHDGSDIVAAPAGEAVALTALMSLSRHETPVVEVA